MGKDYKYKYEMHLHTCPCSGGGEDIRAHIDDSMAKGYSGMVVTNHFYYGDTRIDRELTWGKFVDTYWQDYLYGLEYARNKDFDLLFGLEEHVGDGQEILIYGITAEVITAHPELKKANAEKYAEIVHAAGGLVYQAHPYRNRWYINRPFPLDCLDKLDGIEVYNAANEPAWNAQAEELAKRLGLACIGGSDAHSIGTAGRSGIATKERLRTDAALIKVLKSREYIVLREE